MSINSPTPRVDHGTGRHTVGGGAASATRPWGSHDATNEFTDRDLIITASIFREPAAVAEAKGRAMAKRSVFDDYSTEELRELRQGEMQHNILQGIGRGRIRNLIGDQSAHCIVYLRADGASGLVGNTATACNDCSSGQRATPASYSNARGNFRDHGERHEEAGADGTG